MPVPNFLFSEVEGERETWKRDHFEAMQCRDLERVIRKGLGFFYMIRMADEAWSAKVQAGEAEFSPNKARELRQQYAWWIEPCDGVLSVIDAISRDFEVENAEAFRKCVRVARKILHIDVDGLVASKEQVARGEAEPLTDEVWGALLDSLNA